MSSSGATTTSSSAPPPQVMQNYTQLTGAATGVAQQPLNLYTAPIVAGFTPQQQQAFQDVQNAEGIQVPYINAAAQDYAAATTPLWPTLPSFGTSTVNQYMNPYTTDVTNQLTNLYNQQNAQAAAQLAGQATTSGAYGGDREAIAQGILTQQEQMAQAPTLAQVQQQGYEQAVNEFNNQQASQLAAEQANAWLASQAAFGMAGLGTQAQNQALTGAQASMQAGALQQQQAQEQLNVPYQQYLQTQAYPYQQLSFLTPIVEGTGSLSGGTGSTTQPGPSPISQVAGLATAGAGLYNAFSTPSASTLSYPIDTFTGTTSGLYSRGGRAGFAGGGGIGRFASGGGIGAPMNLVDVPDLSVSFIPKPEPTTPSHGMLSPFQPVTTQTSSGGGGGILGAIGPLVSIGKIAASFLAKDGGAMPGHEHRASGGGSGGIGNYTSFSVPPLPTVPTLDLPWLKTLQQQQQGTHMGAGPPKAPTPGATADPLKDVGNLGNTIGDLGKKLFSDSGSTGSQGSKSGGAIGRGHYDTGGGAGSVPVSVMAAYGGAPPNVQSQLQQLLQLPLSQLQEMAVQYPPTTSQGQLVAQAIAQKQATPGAGTAPMQPAPQQPFVGLGGAPSTGGTASLATSPQSYGGTAHSMAKGGTPDPGPDTRGYVTAAELDPRPVVDHSGRSVRVHYPSEKKSLDLGLPPIRPEHRAAGGSAGASMPAVPHVAIQDGQWTQPGEIALNQMFNQPAQHKPIYGPAMNMGLMGTGDEGIPSSPAASFLGSMSTANGVAIPQLSGSMFAPPQGLPPGEGLPGWYAPLPQTTQFGTGPGGTTIFPTSQAYTPGMAPIFTAYGQPIPAFAGGSSAPAGGTATAAPGAMTQDQIDQMNAATTAANYAAAASSYKRGGRFGEGGGIGSHRPFDVGGDVNYGYIPDEIAFTPTQAATSAPVAPPVDPGNTESDTLTGSGAGPSTLDILQQREADDRAAVDRERRKITAEGTAEGKGGIGKSVTGHPMQVREPSAPIAPAPTFHGEAGPGTQDILQAHQDVSDALDQVSGGAGGGYSPEAAVPSMHTPPPPTPDTQLMISAHDAEGNAIDTAPPPAPPEPELRATPTSPRNEPVSQATQDILREHGEMPSEPFYGRAVPYSQLPERGGGRPLQFGMPSGIGFSPEAAVPVLPPPVATNETIEPPAATPTGGTGGIGKGAAEPAAPDWTKPEYWTRQRYEAWNPATQPVPTTPTPMPQRQVTPQPTTTEAEPDMSPQGIVKRMPGATVLDEKGNTVATSAPTVTSTTPAASKADLFAQAPAAALPPSNNKAPEVWGDSLGVGVNNVLKNPAGYQHGGDPPKMILGKIIDQETQEPGHFRGQDVILSSGTNPQGGSGDMKTVEATMKYLKDHGANVAVIGYGSKYADRDAQLQEYAKSIGVEYVKAGANDGTHMSRDGYDDATGRAKQQLAAHRSQAGAETATAPREGLGADNTVVPKTADGKSVLNPVMSVAADTLMNSPEGKALGINKAKAAGILGSILSESPARNMRSSAELDPKAFNPYDPEGGSHALMQWDPHRLANGMQWARDNNLDWNDPVTQVRFGLHEVLSGTDGSQGRTLAALKAAGDDPAKAALAWAHFERGAHYTSDHPENMIGQADREQAAKGIYAALTEGTPFTGSGITATGGGGGGGVRGGTPTASNGAQPDATPQQISAAARQLAAQAPPHERNGLYTWLHSPGGLLFMIGAGMLASKSPFPGVALGEGLQFAVKGLEAGEAQENKNELSEIRAAHYNQLADAAAARLGLQNELGQNKLLVQHGQLELAAEKLANQQSTAANNFALATEKFAHAQSEDEKKHYERARADALKAMIAAQPKGELAILTTIMNAPGGPKSIIEAQQQLAAARRDPAKAREVDLMLQGEARKRADLEQRAYAAEPTNIGKGAFDTQTSIQRNLDELRGSLGATPAPAAPAAAPAQGQPAAQTAPAGRPDWAIPDERHWLNGREIFSDGRAWYYGDHTPTQPAATQ